MALAPRRSWMPDCNHEAALSQERKNRRFGAIHAGLESSVAAMIPLRADRGRPRPQRRRESGRSAGLQSGGVPWIASAPGRRPALRFFGRLWLPSGITHHHHERKASSRRLLRVESGLPSRSPTFPLSHLPTCGADGTHPLPHDRGCAQAAAFLNCSATKSQLITL